MTLTNGKVNELVALVKKRFPGWKGFSDERFRKDETDYKREAAEKAAELLSETALRRLIAAGNFDEVVARLEKTGRSTNLLFQAVPMSGDLSILYQKTLDKPAFCAAVLNLLYGEDPSHVRLDRFSAYCKDKTLPNKWTFPTYFLFLLFPDKEIFVKPSVVTWFMGFAGADVTFAATPASVFYVWFKQVAGQLLTLLQPFGAKDMIDIQSFIWVCASVSKDEGGARYWKIAPGDNAWQWNECRTGSFIAIGWDGLGDLTGLSKEDLEQRYNEVSARESGWTRGCLSQVGRFLDIQPGDRIVANKGTSQVLGIGTAAGPYYFVPGVRHGHRLPVKWNDVTPREVKQGGWRKTLIELGKNDFDRIVSAPKSADVSDVVRVKESTGTLSYFTERTFELLGQLHENPTKAFYGEHREEFAEHVEKPLRRLLTDVAAELPESIRKHVETDKGILAKIPKNDFGKGGTWDYLWGAFYPRGSYRVADAQLYVTADHRHVHFGFSVGNYGPEQRERLMLHCRAAGKTLAEILSQHDWSDYLQGDGQPADIATWLADPEKFGFHLYRELTSSEVAELTGTELRALVAGAFTQLFPLVLLVRPEDPLPAIRAYLGADDTEEETSDQPTYTLAACADDTSIAESQLAAWLRSVERKGQAILYGPPGTGKTFVAERLARLLVSGGDGFVELVQLHPAYAYEDFIQGIRPESRADGGLRYPIVPGRFLDFCSRAQVVRGKCVLIIDEINRANLARVFGELMYLLEYRDQEVPLAGGGRLRIPANVRLIGTMNTADRSIALVDHALRRRFAFLPLYPQYDILTRYHQERKTGFPVDQLVQVLKEVNGRIGDKHYHVGITFFLLEDLSEQIESIWRTEIEPYLEEYFFDQQDKAESFQWEKVGDRIVKG